MKTPIQLPNGQERTLDYVPRLVEANLRHLVRDARVAAETDLDYLWSHSRWWTGGLVIDQGREGACVGFGCTGEAMASPVRVKFTGGEVRSAPVIDQGAQGGLDVAIAAAQSLFSTSDHTVEDANRMALSVYRRAKEIDEWEGVDYDGTSVRAGMLVGRELGWWDGFKWAKNMDDVRLALEFGPVVLGVDWRAGMYDTDAHGGVRVDGDVVGGHCILLTGYSPNYASQVGNKRFRWRNSWGLGYGVNGNGYITPEDLDRVLFQAGNEAAIPVGRHL